MDKLAGSAAIPVRVGDVLLERYQVTHVLGEGGMGMVVGARHLGNGDLFAIKVLHARLLAGPQAVDRFLREARVVERLTGKHVAKVYEVGRLPSGAPCMVMDRLVGSDLQEVVDRNGPLHVEQAIDYTRQACEGVAEAHLLGIVHRDIKPANLFLAQLPDGSQCIKVLDFGIAKYVGLDGAGGVELTRTGMILGSPAYMSPEQMKQTKNADARSDVWSMGVVLYQLLTGTLPFFAEAVLELAVKVAVDQPVPPSEKRPEVSTVVDDVVLRCLQKNPDLRFQSMRDLALVLNSLRPSADSATVVIVPKRRSVDASPPLGEQHDVDSPVMSAGSEESAAVTLPIRPSPALATTARAVDSDAATPRMEKPPDQTPTDTAENLAFAPTDDALPDARLPASLALGSHLAALTTQQEVAPVATLPSVGAQVERPKRPQTPQEVNDRGPDTPTRLAPKARPPQPAAEISMRNVGGSGPKVGTLGHSAERGLPDLSDNEVPETQPFLGIPLPKGGRGVASPPTFSFPEQVGRPPVADTLTDVKPKENSASRPLASILDTFSGNETDALTRLADVERAASRVVRPTPSALKDGVAQPTALQANAVPAAKLGFPGHGVVWIGLAMGLLVLVILVVVLVVTLSGS